MLSAIPGLSQIFAIIPLGLLSDRKGRKILIIMGLLFFSITPLLYILSKNAYGLILPQIFFGLGMSAASPMLIVYLFEVIDPTKTGPVFGLYTMFMGSGFALGSLLGGYFAHFFGYPTNYYSSSIIASIAMIASLIAIKEDPRSYVKKIGSSQTNVKSVFSLIRDTRILIASLTVFGIVSIDKTIFGFFPLYGKSVGLNELDMGYIFTIRAICSTVIRMPTGLSLRKIGKRNLMYIALLTSSLSTIFVSRFHQPVFLAVFIAIEGIGMGILLTVGPLFVLESFV
jgi:MFS family permease